MSEEFESLLSKAKLLENCERYEDMAHTMKTLAQLKKTYTIEERNLFSVAYKNLVTRGRYSYGAVTANESDEPEDSVRAQVRKEVRELIEADLVSRCGEVIDLLDTTLLPEVDTPDSRIFYHKMKGDYYRYLAEFNIGEKGTEAANNSLASYKAATEEAEKCLTPDDPIRLGLALNFSVFHYEILNNPTKACELARSAHEEALKTYKNYGGTKNEVDIILQLLSDNLKLWADEDQANGIENPELEKATAD